MQTARYPVISYILANIMAYVVVAKGHDILLTCGNEELKTN